MPIFRYHRGGLEDSLKTVVLVKSLKDIEKIAMDFWSDFNLTDKKINIKVQPYLPEIDYRIGWFTQIVMCDFPDPGVFYPIGFLSEPFQEDENDPIT